MSRNFKKVQGRSQPMYEAEASWEIYVASYQSLVTNLSFENRIKLCIRNLQQNGRKIVEQI
jgi:hypothetical protein